MDFGQRLVGDGLARIWPGRGMAGAPLSLGLVERLIGIGDEPVGVDGVVVMRHRDPDAGRDAAGGAVPVDGFLEPVNDPAGNGAKEVDVVAIVEDQHEFVAADAGDHIRAAHLLPQDAGDDLEDAVAGGVAEGIVHGLEVVEVEMHEAEGRSVAQRKLPQVGVHGAAIAQAGELVGLCRLLRGGEGLIEAIAEFPKLRQDDVMRLHQVEEVDHRISLGKVAGGQLVAGQRESGVGAEGQVQEEMTFAERGDRAAQNDRLLPLGAARLRAQVETQLSARPFAKGFDVVAEIRMDQADHIQQIAPGLPRGDLFEGGADMDDLAVGVEDEGHRDRGIDCGDVDTEAFHATVPRLNSRGA